MLNEARQQTLVRFVADEGRGGFRVQFGHVGGAVVRQAVAFGVAPQRFDRVQVGRVARQGFEKHIASRLHPLLHELRAMSLQVIPDDDQRTAHVPPQLPQERPHLRTLDRFFGVQADIRAQSSPLRRDRNRADGGNLTCMSRSMHELRCFSHGRPGPLDVRRQEQAAFIDEGDVGILGLRFFLIRRQSRATQRSIAAGSRSRARRCGFWHVKPSDRSTHGT